MPMQETQETHVRSEDLLEEGMATYSSMVAWKISWTEEPVAYSPWDHKESDMTEQLSTHTYTLITLMVMCLLHETWLH